MKCWTNIQQVFVDKTNANRIVPIESSNLQNGLVGHNLISKTDNWKIDHSLNILNLNFWNELFDFIFPFITTFAKWLAK